MRVVFVGNNYNAKYNTSFLGTQSWPGWPIWEASKRDFLRTINLFFFHMGHIYSYVTILVFCFLLCFSLLNRKHLDPLIYGILILLLLGVVLFVCMFFVGVGDNIYYIINLMVLPVFILIASALIFKNRFPGSLDSKRFKIVLSAFLIFNVFYAKGKLKEYYHEGKLHWHSNISFYKPAFRSFVDSIGIKKTDKIISFPDATPDVTLYMIGRQGWSGFDAQIEEGSINNCIRNGAKYLFINDPSILSNPVLMNYTGDYVANFDNIFIYRLSSPSKKTILLKGILKNSKNQFLTITEDSEKQLQITPDSLKATIFKIVPLGKDFVAIRTENNKSLSCDVENKGKISASHEWVGSWEIFKMIKNDDKTINIKGVNGSYFSVEGINIKAKTIEKNLSERFQLIYK
ncbi:MAG: hypothetical protein JWP12_2381 [Bacteroidetes bacterium]|nr:hypothetical protein [Bacteroidota bacterium]